MAVIIYQLILMWGFNPFIALKKSYVDVFNPSGAAPKNDKPILAPTMPTMPAQSNMNFFIPAAVPNNNQQNVSKFIYLFFSNITEMGLNIFYISYKRKDIIEIKLATILQHQSLHRIPL